MLNLFLFIVHRSIDYPQVIGLILGLISKCVTKTRTNYKNVQTHVEMAKKLYFFTQAADSNLKKGQHFASIQKMICTSVILIVPGFIGPQNNLDKLPQNIVNPRVNHFFR